MLAGEGPKGNTVYADQYGVWITGVAPVLDDAGDGGAAVAANMPALGRRRARPAARGEPSDLRGLLQSAAARLSRAEIEAITDALTGLYNHRYLHERLSEELHRGARAATPSRCCSATWTTSRSTTSQRPQRRRCRAARDRPPHRAVRAHVDVAAR